MLLVGVDNRFNEVTTDTPEITQAAEKKKLSGGNGDQGGRDQDVPAGPHSRQRTDGERCQAGAQTSQ